MSEETKTEPNPATAEPGRGETAPETKTPQGQQTAGETKVDPGQETPPGATERAPAWFKAEVGKLRQDRRDLKSRLEAMSAELETLKQSSAAPAPSQMPPASNGKGIFDDPDGYLEQRDRKLLSSIEGILKAKLEEHQAGQRHASAAEEAQKWLLSQEGLDTDEAVDEIRDILSDEELLAVSRVAPKKAAKIAYMEWRESKGLPPVGGNKPSAARAGGVKPSGSTGSAGPRTYSDAEFKTALEALKPGDPNFRAKWTELMKVQTEGRIK